MSVTALVSGRLLADPEQRTGQSGKPFTLGRAVAQTEDGEVVVSLIAFGSTAEKLAAMSKGDTVAITGRAKVTTWEGRDGMRAGLSLTVDGLLTGYHLRRKRQAMNEPDGDDFNGGHR